MAKLVVKHIYLPSGVSIDTQIEALKPQMVKGYSVLMWREDGVLAFVTFDPSRDMMDPAWMVSFIAAAVDHYRSQPTGEGT